MPLPRSPAVRACDTCRRRKVKCDAAQPCSNCRVSQRCCEYTVARKKRGPKVPNANGQPEEAVVCSGAGTSVSVATPANDQVWSEVALSWQSANMSSPAASQDTLYSCRTDRLIWERLLAAVKPVLPDLSVVDVVNNCIDLYMRYTFPTAPLVHEPSLRTAASFFFSDTAPTNVFRTDSGEERVAQLRAFCLVTGLCASIASVIPEDLLPHRRFLTVPFLNASREALAAFEDHDLEHPNSASLTIRSFHSTAMQQNTGKFGAAWHIHSQACLLAQHLRLYSEQTVNQHDALEAHLLRLNFWQLYASDKAASAFRTRPFTLHETLFDEELTLQPYGEQHIFLLDQDRSADNRLLEERLLVGFHLIRTIWSSAASLLSALRSYPRSRTEETRSRLGQEYLDFMGLIDDLPPWLRISKIASPHDDGDVAAAHKPSFWVQRCTVMVTFYCLRLVILQQCVDSDACEVAGFARDQVSTLLVKKFEMIQDFIQTLEDIPFLYLQVKGEPNTERIRRVGAILLELIKTRDSEPLEARARSFLRRLLDILAKLDSKASDSLAVI